MERDIASIVLDLISVISTHTLTWSVTGIGINAAIINKNISTHTLTWSVTENIKFSSCKNFISTHTLTWSVTAYYIDYYVDEYISTHTLTWSVTFGDRHSGRGQAFQLTRSRGA